MASALASSAVSAAGFVAQPITLPATITKVPHVGYLLPNGARIIVATDAATKKSSCAASMFVGSHWDPVDAPGLAHLCEHMCFLGTQTYPEEGGFDKFLSSCAGHSNAYTTDSQTCYYFEASTADDRSTFKEALDRFAGFFVEPAMTASGLEREVQAVHSEDEKNHEVEYWRTQEVLKLHLFDTAHPHSRYGNGNAATLWDGPRARGVDMHKVLLDFYDKYYSAENLVMAVYSPLSGAEVLDILLPHISKARVLGHRNEHRFGAEALTSRETLFRAGVATGGAWCNVKANTDMQSLSIMWPLRTCRANKHRFNTAHTLSWLVGHECKGTPADVLRERDYITALSTGHTEIDDENQLFTCRLTLTQKGLAELDDVIDLLFDGLSFFRARVGADPELHADMIAGSRLLFNLSELRSPSTHATMLARNANEYGTDRAWIGGGAAEELDAAELSQMFDVLVRPERALFQLHLQDPNAVIAASLRDAGDAAAADKVAATEKQQQEKLAALTAKKGDEAEGKSAGDDGSDEDGDGAAAAKKAVAATRLPVTKVAAMGAAVVDTITEHHRARFGLAKIDDATLQRWGRDRTDKWCPLFKRPKPNHFLSSEYGLLTLTPEASGGFGPTSFTQRPVFLHETDDDSVWGRVMWRPDAGLYETPRCVVQIALESPAAYRDPKARFFSRVLSGLLEYSMAELTYFAQLAAYDCEFSAGFSGLSITAAAGPRHKALVVAKAVLSQLVNEILGGSGSDAAAGVAGAGAVVGSETKYRDVADTVLRSLRSTKIKAPYEQGRESQYMHMYGRRFDWADVLGAVEDRVPAFADFLAFVRGEFLARVRFDVLVAGNATRADAAEVGDFLQNEVIGKLIAPRVPGVCRARPDELLEPTTVLAPPSRAELAAGLGPTLPPPPPLFGACITRPNTNPDDVNCAAVVTFYLGPCSPAVAVLSNMVVALLRAHYFEALRTRETIGYIVSMSAADLNHNRVVHLVAQSAKESAFYVFSRTHAFLEAAAAFLAPRTGADAAGDDPLAPKVEKARRSLLASARDKPKNLNAFTGRTWANVNNTRFGFDNVEAQARLLESKDAAAIGPDAVRRFFHDFFVDPQKARCVVALTHGNRDKDVPTIDGQCFADNADWGENRTGTIASAEMKLPPCSVEVPAAGDDCLVLPDYKNADAAPSVRFAIVGGKDTFVRWRKQAAAAAENE